MTVAELIEKLSEMDQGSPVMLFTSDGVFAHRLAGVADDIDGRVILSGRSRPHP
jgi:hypothetical protein